jgi:NTE family protein
MFYDNGGILSNTPIRELLSNHSSFWTKKHEEKLISTLDKDSKLTFDKWKDFYKLQEENIIPDLKLTIVNLHPESEKGNNIPSLYDYDLTKDRERDIRFHDKTEYDIKLAQNISDYHDFVVEMMNLASDAISKNAHYLKPEFEDILNKHQRTSSRKNQTRHFYDLIGKRFNIDDVLKIQKKDDIHTVSDKIFDFSSDTILNLIKEGERDALKEIVDHELKKEDKNSINNQLIRFIEDVKKESTEDDDYIIQCAKDELKRKKYFIEIQ